MKNKPLHFLIFTLGILLAINACTKKPETISPSDNSLNNYFTSNRNKTQKFTCNADQNNTIIGSKGTKVFIGGGTLRTMSGETVTGNVTIELKEVTEFSDMILNNASTVSNGKLLKSGGEFYISANQNGTPLTLDPNANYFIEIAAPHGTSDSMNVFTGTDASGVITWSPVQADTVNNNIQVPDTLGKTALYDSSAYFNYHNTAWAIMNNAYSYILKCTSFGWINADYFIEMNVSNLCEETVTLDPSSNLIMDQTNVYYLLPASNSCAMLYHVDGGYVFKGGIPNKQNIKIIALSFKDDKCYISVTDHFVNCNNTNQIVLTFTELQESDISTVLATINI